MSNQTESKARNITVGSKVRIEKGCKDLEITKGASALVMQIVEMGAEYGHFVKIVLMFRNSYLSGQTRVLYARHINRLDDAIVNLNDGRPEHKVQISKVA